MQKEYKVNISTELYDELCNTLTDFEHSENDTDKPDYLSDGEWLDIFYNLCVRLQNELEEIDND